MTARLHPHLPHVPGEWPPSYASRLARFHGAGSARILCRDFSIKFRDVVDGRADALGRLAEVAGVPASALLDQALVRTDDGFVLKGEAFVRSTLQRTRLRGCPACLVTDMAAAGLSDDAAMAGRTRWLLRPLRTCPIHRVALVETASSASHRHDFALAIEGSAEAIRRMERDAMRRPPSGLEAYLDHRLEGLTGGAAWLDALPWHAAARTCEMLGAVAVAGRTPDLRRFSEDDWHRAGGAGFVIARDGERGIRVFLSDLQRSYPAS